MKWPTSELPDERTAVQLCGTPPPTSTSSSPGPHVLELRVVQRAQREVALETAITRAVDGAADVVLRYTVREYIIHGAPRYDLTERRAATVGGGHDVARTGSRSRFWLGSVRPWAVHVALAVVGGARRILLFWMTAAALPKMKSTVAEDVALAVETGAGVDAEGVLVALEGAAERIRIGRAAEAGRPPGSRGRRCCGTLRRSR
ncbi:uncharacterized protein A4U43_C04F35500 [Asparagus officinalis]|uniref:Uncharacterized protein n=1 Tax=Asparagus officinalis TaxID=4686 RepID=A0A5P1FAJ5_ASPOF|nr:uncharacterized protein A4U43_C04F35500 [Asparagus officinalis]